MNTNTGKFLLGIAWVVTLSGCSRAPSTPSNAWKVQPVEFAETSVDAPFLTLETGGHQDRIFALFLLDNDRTILTCATDGTIRYWDVASETNTETIRVSPETLPAIHAATLSPNHRYLALAGSDPSIVILDLEQQTFARPGCQHAEDAWVTTLQFSPSGDRILTGSSDSTIIEWNWRTGEQLQRLQLKGGIIRDVAYSDDAKKIASAASRGPARIHHQNLDIVSEIKHYSTPRCVRFLPGTHGVVVGWDRGGAITVSDADGTERHYSESVGHWIQSVSVNSEGNQILFTSGWHWSEKGPLCGVINLKEEATRVSFEENTGLTSAGAFFQNGNVVTAGGTRREMLIWNPTDRRVVSNLHGEGANAVSAAWSEDGRQLGWRSVVGIGAESKQGLTGAFDPEKLKVVPASDASAWHFAIPRRNRMWFQGDYVLNSRQDTICKISNNTVAEQACNKFVCRTFLPNDQIAAGSLHGLYLFDLFSGEQLFRFAGPETVIVAVSPSPVQPYLLTVSSNMMLQVWSVYRNLPILNLFVTEKEWLAWTPEGYYACSENAEGWLGWQISHGPDRPAEFRPAREFRETYHRPELIAQVLDAGSVSKALEGNQLKKVDIVKLLDDEPAKALP